MSYFTFKIIAKNVTSVTKQTFVYTEKKD